MRAAALRVRESVLEFSGRERVTYYIHAAVHHLPEQVLECPVDIIDCSGCAIEHVNKIVRTRMRCVNLNYFLENSLNVNRHGSNKKRFSKSKNGVVQANRTAQALTSIHMSGLEKIRLIKQRLQRNIGRREVKLRCGRVAKLLVKTDIGIGLLQTPWIDGSEARTEISQDI